MSLAKRLDSVEAYFDTSTGVNVNTRFGIVCPKDGLLRVIQDVEGKFIEVGGEPDLNIPAKMELVLTNPKRFIILWGGRGSGKSQNIGGIETSRMKDYAIKLGCFREYQSSIADSVHSLLSTQARVVGGFTITEKAIRHANSGQAKFRGLALNPDSIKSMDSFNDFWTEEAQSSSDRSLKLLTPTMRSVGGRLIFTANPGSSEDPFSQRFITPFIDLLDANGIYEDDLHLIIRVNYTDNPWFPEELESERAWDYKNLPRALYDHIWEGAFNDSVENSLINAEWFDACVDAHKKLGFDGVGVKIAAHDPSDMGADSKGYALRHGSVITDLQEMTTGNVNEGCHWATGLAIQAGCDAYTWDCDGMGVALNEQTSAAMDGKGAAVSMYKGSEGPDFPEAMYEPSQRAQITNQKTNKESFRNKRAQYYFQLRDRVYRTYRAVVHNEYQDPEKLISFSSDIAIIAKLRAELCRMPIKPNGNGLFDLYTKQEMKTKFKFKSPNLADSVVMSLRFVRPNNKQAVRRPKPMRQIRPR